MEAARRELIEETGYDSSNYSILTRGIMSTGIDTEEWKIVLAEDAAPAIDSIKARHTPDENEDIEVYPVAIQDIYSRLQNFTDQGDDIDLRIYGLLDLARRRLSKEY